MDALTSLNNSIFSALAQDMELDDMLAALRKCDSPGICVTAFVIDGKSGKGSYISRKGRLKRVDDYERRLIFLDGKSIPLEHILKIQLDEGIY